MSAADYKIFLTPSNAYIARPNIRNLSQMSNDRDKIDEEDIMSLIDWYLNTQLTPEFDYLSFISYKRKGKKLVLAYIDDDANLEQ